MKKITLPLVLAVLFSINLAAQYNFVVQNQGMNVYKTLQEAYDNANAGDTIYLPGGSFDMPVIEKPLVWIGVGYHPDSCAATYFTRINNSVTMNGNCDNTSITGVRFAANLAFGSNLDPVMNMKISRCIIDGSLSLKYNDSQETAINGIISECIINGTIDGNKGSNFLVEKCVIRGVVSDFIGSVFNHSIFTLGTRNYSSGYSYTFAYTSDCLVKNSIINRHSYLSWRIDAYGCMNNSFMNNLFSGAITFPQGTNTGTDNLTEIDITTVFEHIEGVLSDDFLLHDLHLLAGSPAIGAGLSGVDMGIYGGTEPFKEGGLPYTPHISNISIGSETVDGMLPINITVTAQDK